MGQPGDPTGRLRAWPQRALAVVVAAVAALVFDPPVTTAAPPGPTITVTPTCGPLTPSGAATTIRVDGTGFTGTFTRLATVAIAFNGSEVSWTRPDAVGAFSVALTVDVTTTGANVITAQERPLAIIVPLPTPSLPTGRINSLEPPQRLEAAVAPAAL
jgi:hypothetical protein